MVDTKRTGRKVSEQWLQQCLAGDRRAQNRLYQQFINPFLNIAYRVVWHEEDARDIVQESFLKIFRELDKLQSAAKFEGWAKRIVVNTAVTHLRQQKRMPTFALEREDLLTENNTAPSHSSDDDDTTAWTVGLVKKALQELAPGYRTVISLYLLEGYDHQEIADILGISVSTSITQFNRGKKKLRLLVQNRLANG